MLNLAHFWLPFGTRWLPLGSPWLTFGSLWLTFGSRWLTFGSLWLPFGSLLVPFGSLLVPMGSLLLTLALYFLTFGVSLRRFWYFYVFSSKTLCKIVFLGKCSLKFRLFPSLIIETLSAKYPRTISSTLFCVPTPPRPRAEHFEKSKARWRERGIAALKIMLII